MDVVTSSLRVDMLLLATMLLPIFTTHFIVSSFYIETLCTVLDGGAPWDTFLGMSLQVPDKLHILRSLAMSFNRCFCPPSEYSRQQGNTREAAKVVDL